MTTTAKTATDKAVKLAKKLTFLNAPVVTAPGVFRYEKLTPSAARKIVTEFSQSGRKIDSAVGHEATAELMSRLLHFPVEFNRTEFEQKPGDIALILRLHKRTPEGKILCCHELEEIGYELGLLTRID
jgi:(2Fe-2S) ferredoxin